MPTFELVLPEGRLLLKDPATGAVLTLSAEAGPVSLGLVELKLGAAGERSVGPEHVFSLHDSPNAAAMAAEAAGTAALGAALNAYEGDEAGRRVLLAPLDALTSDDFERSFEALAAKTTNLEREIAFLEEIEADESSLAEVRRDLEVALDTANRVSARKAEYDAAQNGAR